VESLDFVSISPFQELLHVGGVNVGIQRARMSIRRTTLRRLTTMI
jgi:hypothetical protein